jgi:hypothetical protein
MNRFLSVCFALLMLAASFSFAADSTAAKSKIFGKTPTLTEPVAIATLNIAPADLVNKSVLVTGKITAMCLHSGCWVEIESPDSSRIICKSLDESIHFTKECLGKSVALQGTLMYDGKAPGDVEKAHAGETAHSCPAPKVLVSIEGATVNLAATEPAPAVTPTESAK